MFKRIRLWLTQRRERNRRGRNVGGVVAFLGEGEFPLVEDNFGDLWLIHATGRERVNGIAGAINMAHRWDRQGVETPPREG